MNWYEAEYRELFAKPIAERGDLKIVWWAAGRVTSMADHLESARLGNIPDQELMRDIFERYLVFLVTRQRDTERR